MEMQKLRITAKTRREQRYGVVFMGKKVASLPGRDPGDFNAAAMSRRFQARINAE